ncbi:MAG: DUF3185 family protein [Azospirillum sp.]|nr:DUF3185 family protein [Azospirillum sp.]
MTSNQVFGIVILAIGIALLGVAYNASNAPLDQISNAVTGRFTDRTMWYGIGGAAAALAGVLLMLVGRRA